MATIETNSNHINSDYLTRWYKNDYEECKSAILSIAKELSYSVKHVNDNFFEILVDSQYYSSVFNITQITPLKTAIDVTICNTKLFKKPLLQMNVWFEELEKKLNFVGKGGGE